MDTLTHFFDKLDRFITEAVLPNNAALDDEPALLNQIYHAWIKTGAHKLFIPTALGGLGGDRATWLRYNVLIAQHSGALLFLQAQHQIVIQTLKALSTENADHFLQTIAKNEIGFAYCGKVGETALRGGAQPNGFNVTGTLPWVTGFQYYDQVFTQFTQDDTVYYITLPFKETQTAQGSIILTPVIDTIAFKSVNTVGMKVKDWFVPNEAIIEKRPITDMPKIAHPAPFNFLGAAIALLNIASQGKYAQLPEAKKAAASLQAQCEHYQNRIEQSEPDQHQLRAVGQKLSVQCAEFARFTTGAMSMQSTHPINRLIKEIWQYTVSGLSEKQVAAYMKAL